ncbi:MAG: hypothetical protein IKI57_03510 [Clostridia bacterium]|nr:hypothetical protein [Clostridia bacterium]
MKKFLSNVAKIGAGILIGSTMTVFAAQLVSPVYLNTELKISKDGVIQTLRDAATGAVEYPLTYRDRTYIPLRSVATILGYNVGYEADTNTATVDSPGYVKPSTPTTPTTPTNPDYQPSSKIISVDDIPCVKALNWQPAPLKDYSSLLSSTYVISNVVNSLYQTPDNGPDMECVHPDSPLKEDLKNAIANIVAQRNKYGSGATLSIFCNNSSVTVSKYGYDANGKCRGCLATYTLEYTFTLNGQTQKQTQTITSVFVFKDSDNLKLAWVADAA